MTCGVNQWLQTHLNRHSCSLRRPHALVTRALCDDYGTRPPRSPKTQAAACRLADNYVEVRSPFSLPCCLRFLDTPLPPHAWGDSPTTWRSCRNSTWRTNVTCRNSVPCTNYSAIERLIGENIPLHFRKSALFTKIMAVTMIDMTGEWELSDQTRPPPRAFT